MENIINGAINIIIVLSVKLANSNIKAIDFAQVVMIRKENEKIIKEMYRRNYFESSEKLKWKREKFENHIDSYEALRPR